MPNSYEVTARWVAVPALVGLGAAGLSLLFPLSYDEGHWLAIIRMVSSGATLYESAIDNKSPLVYLAVSLIDLLPGEFQTARAAVVGAIAALIAHLVIRGGARSRRSEVSFAIVIPLTLLLLGSFRLQTELLAAPSVLGALQAGRRGHPVRGGLLALLATCITPLAAMSIPIALALSRRDTPRRRWLWSVAITGTAGGAILAVILVNPALRYGLVELNFASRQSLGVTSLSPLGRAAFTIAALIPFITIGWWRGWGPKYYAVAGLLSLPVLAARLAFLHYWIVTLSGMGAFPTKRESTADRRPWVILTAGLLPVALVAFGSLEPDRRVVSRYEAIVGFLDDLPSNDWTFATIDLQPFLAISFPDRIALRSPSINYLAWETSRSSAQREELDRVLDEVDVLIDPGLSVGAQPAEGIAVVIPIFQRHLNEFGCQHDVGGVKILLKPRLCDDETVP